MAQPTENPAENRPDAAAEDSVETARRSSLPFGRRTLIIAAVGLPVLALLALLAWASVSSGGSPSGLAVNNSFAEVDVEAKAAPEFTLELLDGSVTSIAELRGQVVLLDFWASWCLPCRDEAPVLAQVYEEYRERGVEFVGVNLWDNPGDAELFLQQQGHEYPNGVDAGGKIAISYGVRGIPEKFFVNRNGQIARKFSGPMNAALLRETLDTLLAQP